FGPQRGPGRKRTCTEAEATGYHRVGSRIGSPAGPRPAPSGESRGPRGGPEEAGGGAAAVGRKESADRTRGGPEGPGGIAPGVLAEGTQAAAGEPAETPEGARRRAGKVEEVAVGVVLRIDFFQPRKGAGRSPGRRPGEVEAAAEGAGERPAAKGQGVEAA